MRNKLLLGSGYLLRERDAGYSHLIVVVVVDLTEFFVEGRAEALEKSDLEEFVRLKVFNVVPKRVELANVSRIS